MSQKSLNDLLRAEDKAGWIEKKREGMGCGIKELEASWNRNVERYKKTLPSEKTQLKTLLERATKDSKGIRYRDSSAYNKKKKKKSSLRNASHQSTNALTPKEQTRLALESMRERESESESESKISSKTSKGSGKRKRKIKKTRKKRGGAWMDYASFHSYISNNQDIIGKEILVRHKSEDENGNWVGMGNGSKETLVSDNSFGGNYDFTFQDPEGGPENYYECCVEGDIEEVEFKLLPEALPRQAGGTRKKRKRRRTKKKRRRNKRKSKKNKRKSKRRR